ncbi:hypothetical protein [Burkholderia ambifaria]|uniref:hypothetical protein n=1 Tax=Burkholderia ambifaria TaxID=152480 RepID=UPI000F7FFAF9|nr:hypothetical protein [Burkholderia ambifaria]
MLRFFFNKKAFVALAKELRRASWGAAAASTAVGVHVGSGLSLLLGAVTWTALQAMAFALDSVRNEK